MPDDVTISGIQYPDAGGGLTVQAKHPAFAFLALETMKLFKKTGGVNYVEWTMGTQDPAFGTFSIIIQRKAGKTPAEKAAKYKAALVRITTEDHEARTCNYRKIAQEALKDR